jgi:hypothetical protein
MNYAKPEIVPIGSALDQIQGTPKPLGDTMDNGVWDGATPGAYESDE